MPKGNPKKQTIATDKYQKKAGYCAKTFKLKQDLVNEFMSTCEKLGVGQAATISDFMRKFIEENK